MRPDAWEVPPPGLPPNRMQNALIHVGMASVVWKILLPPPKLKIVVQQSLRSCRMTHVGCDEVRATVCAVGGDRVVRAPGADKSFHFAVWE